MPPYQNRGGGPEGVGARAFGTGPLAFGLSPAGFAEQCPSRGEG